jgi:sugar lactone lactonase YvrE
MIFKLRARLLGLAIAALVGPAALGQSVNTFIAGTLDSPSGIAVAKNGDLYVTNFGDGSVRIVMPGGIVRQLATGLNGPTSVALDAAGNAFVIEGASVVTNTASVVKITPDGVVTNFVSAAQGISQPEGLAFDASGNLFVASIIPNDPAGEVEQVFKVTPDGTATLFLANAGYGSGLAFDPSGNLYIAGDNALLKATPSGVVSTLAMCDCTSDIAIDASGTLFVGAFSGAILKITPTGTVSTFTTAIPGGGSLAFDGSGNLLVTDLRLDVTDLRLDVIDALDPSAKLTPVLTTPVATPAGIVADGKGNLFIANQTAGTIVKAAANGAVTTIGSGFGTPFALALAPSGTLFIADGTSNSISKLAPDGTITPFISNLAGALALDANGNLYVAGQDGNFQGAVLKVTPAGTTSVFADVMSIETPFALAFDPSGNLFAAVPEANVGGDHEPSFIAKITPAGVASAFPPGEVLTLGAPTVSGPIATDLHGNLLVASATAITSYAPDGTPTPVATLTGTNVPVVMTIDAVGNLYASDQVANSILQVVLAPSPLASAVLPGGRSVETGAPATVFATLINSGSAALDTCQILSPSDAPSGLTLDYRPTDPTTNAVAGMLDTPITIPANGSQTFVIGFTATTPFSAAALAPFFSCASATQAPVVIGVNTVDLNFSATPIADIIALSATPSGNGIVTVPFSTGGGAAFALATINAGAAAALTAVTDTGSAGLPVTVTLCQTVPATGACITAPSASVPITIAENATPTFSVFLKASAAINFAPATARIFVRFMDDTGLSHGSTSVAVATD